MLMESGGSRVEGVRRIAVLRGGGLGDVLLALPAIDAMAAAYPDAHITLLGTPLHAALFATRPGSIDDVEVLPIVRGVRDGADDPAATEQFCERMRNRTFDLALQLHGGGRYSNPFLERLGARVTAGLRTEDARQLDRWVPYHYYQHEVFRALEVAGVVGAAPVALEPQLAVRPVELAKGFELVGASGPLLVMHPGATDPRRRWPVERFAAIARRVAHEGGRVVVVGDASESALANDIVAYAGDGVTSLAGSMGIADLVGVLALAHAFVGNDSGPRHLAQAIGCPTVSIYWVGNLINAGPLGRSRHRVHVAWTTRCPVCGRDATQVGWTAARCEHDVSFVSGTPEGAVYRDVVEFMATTPPVRER